MSTSMPGQNNKEILEIIQKFYNLTRDEQFRLLEELLIILHQQEVPPQPPHSIMELKGLGKETWKDVDVDQYINEERNSWDR